MYPGIPLSSIENEGEVERGIVVFTLQQLPDGQPFYFEQKDRLKIERTGENLYTINGTSFWPQTMCLPSFIGREFKGAIVRQALPADSSILDLVFPHGRKDADDEIRKEVEETGIEPWGPTNILQKIWNAAREVEPHPEEEDELARAMLKEFDERLKGTTLRRAQEKRRRLTQMMRRYSADPSSPFSGLFLPSSAETEMPEPGNVSTTTEEPETKHNNSENGALTVGEEAGDEEPFEDVDLGTPRFERFNKEHILGTGTGKRSEMLEANQDQEVPAT